jgi:hypothetical protein
MVTKEQSTTEIIAELVNQAIEALRGRGRNGHRDE